MTIHKFNVCSCYPLGNDDWGHQFLSSFFLIHFTSQVGTQVAFAGLRSLRNKNCTLVN